MNEEVEITLLQDEVTVDTPLVADYILPTATSSTLGGVKIGDNIDIDSTGHISVPIASASSVGLVKVGTGLAVSSDGTLTATGTYELPEATKNTLGGVYVDDELSTTSTHPVQNAVVSLELQEIDGDVSTLSGTVSGLSTTVGNLSNTVGTLNTTVTTLGTTVTTQGNAITTNASDITAQSLRIDGVVLDLTDTGNALATLQGNVNPVLIRVTESANYDDLTVGTWTSGKIDLYRRGYTGIVYSDLEGSLTIPANDSVILYTMDDSDHLPTVESIGYMISDLGMIRVTFNTDGEFEVHNDNNSSVTIAELKGNIPIVFT